MKDSTVESYTILPSVERDSEPVTRDSSTTNTRTTRPSSHWQVPRVFLHDLWAGPSKGYKLTQPDRNESSCQEVVSGYEFARDSGALAFWDEPDEDIYTFEDGSDI